MAAEAQVIVTNNGQPFAAIDSTWTKPIRRWSTIRINNNTASCGALGSGGDVETNRRKNRSDVPDTSYFVTLNAIRRLPDSTLWRRGERDNWVAADRRVVFPYEGIPVTVVGFFEFVRPQSGNSESTNCGARYRLACGARCGQRRARRGRGCRRADSTHQTSQQRLDSSEGKVDSHPPNDECAAQRHRAAGEGDRLSDAGSITSESHPTCMYWQLRAAAMLLSVHAVGDPPGDQD